LKQVGLLLPLFGFAVSPGRGKAVPKGGFFDGMPFAPAAAAAFSAQREGDGYGKENGFFERRSSPIFQLGTGAVAGDAVYWGCDKKAREVHSTIWYR